MVPEKALPEIDSPTTGAQAPASDDWVAAVRELFAPLGRLAQKLPDFTPRTAQQEMAVAVAHAIATRAILVAEAGTGTGKTFAYLVPALLSGLKTIVSTGTRALQDQLFHRDLPRVRDALDGAGESFSATGRRLSEKLLGDLPDFRLGDGSLHLQPNCWFHLLADHVITFAAFPMSENRTLVRTTWLVADDAVEGVDYRTDELTHVWRQTNLQDAEFVALTQRGVSDPGYLPGPYTPTEHQVEAFVNWYTMRMQEYAR